MNKNKVPLFISAEAVLKPAKGEKYILEATRNDFASLKQFNAPPQSVQQGVAMLKVDGFTVTRIGKGNISVQGFSWQFEQTFHIKLQATDTGITTTTAKRFGIIELQKIDRYQEIFAGLLLARPGTKSMRAPFKGTTPPAVGIADRTANQIIPTQLSELLGGGELYKQYLKAKPAPGKKIKVAVLDSGYYKHEYFKDLNEQVKVIQDPNFVWTNKKRNKLKHVIDKLNELSVIINDLLYLEATLNDGDYDANLAELKKSEKSEKEIYSGLNINIYSTTDALDIKLKIVKQKLANCEKVYDKLNVSFDVYFATQDNYNYQHGTQLVPQLLTIAPHASVEVCKVFMNGEINNQWAFDDSSLGFFLDLVTSRRDIHIVSNSWGNDLSQLTDNSPLYNTDLTILLAPPSQVLLFAAGNYDLTDKRSPENLREKEAEFPNVISVGGAYKENAKKHGIITASNGAFGYPFRLSDEDRFVPDVCGWIGRNDSDDYNLWVPAFSKDQQKPPEDAWVSTWGGTSSATAQLAGVCAVIKYFWPGADSDQIRQVLKESADTIATGKSAQKNEMKGKAGLANIENAILKAQIYSLDQQISFLRKGLGLEGGQ
jgi:hypothetical protein